MSETDIDIKGRILKRAVPTTIQDKFLVGYQGWFTCGGDGEPVGPGHHGWLHWFDTPIPYGGRPNMDLLPDVSSYSPSELFPAPGLKTRSGEQVFLFSSRHPKTVQRHFHWMAEHGIDGAFLQRFVGQCDLETGCEGILKIRDEVGDRVREAAEKEGRVFAIMYDVSGVAPERVQQIIERDWIHLLREKGMLDSPNYIREKGKAVVALWGFGFDGRNHTPALVRGVTNYIRSVTPGGVYIVAGAPAHWRTAESDADRNPEFLDVWLNEFDAISPWTVGRFADEQGADHFAETKMKGDFDLIQRRNAGGSQRKIDYIPVVLPGGSGFNLSQGKWGFNGIKRKGGRFLWQQVFNAKYLGVRTIYGAMWDEYDEGTAFMPAIEKKRNLPVSDKFPFLALDEDGYDLPSDWYMRVCGFAAEGLRNERQIHQNFPVKELQDYWSSRPKYEEVESKVDGHEFKEGGSSGGNGQSYEEWLAAQKEAHEEFPPPPYSLEAEESTSTQPHPSSSSTSAVTQPSAPSGTSSVAGLSHTEQNLTATHILSSQSQAPQSQSFIQPPPVNMGSRPQQPPVPPAGTATPSVPSISQDAVSLLANEFGKAAFTTQSQDVPPSKPKPSVVPPPLHPARPAYGKRPQTSHASHPPRPGSIPRPQSQGRPGSQSVSAYPSSPVNSGYAFVHGSPKPQQVSSSASDVTPIPNPWGPDAPAQQQVPSTGQSTYPVQSTGAKLSRPHTFTASSLAASSRPHGSASPQQQQGSPSASPGPGTVPYRPPLQQSYGPSASSSYAPGGAAQFPGSGHPSYAAPNLGAPLFPTGPNQYLYPSGSSAYPDQSVSSTYPVQANYSPPGQNVLVPPVQDSLPQTPPSASSSSSFPGGPYPLAQAPSQGFPSGLGPSYPGQPYGVASTSVSQYPPVSYGGFTPNNGPSQAESVYFPQAQMLPFPPSQSYQSSNQSSPEFPSYYTQQGPGAPYNAGPSSGLYHGSSSNPTLPPRPPTTAPYAYPTSQAPAFPSATSFVASGALGMALNAVDKVAGKKTREQLESGVGTIAQSGGKLFNKLTK